MTDWTCGLCGSQLSEPYLRFRSGYQIFVCRHCDNAATFPEPTKSYDHHAFHLLAGASERRWRRYSRQIVQFIDRQYGSSGRLLDVGCSHGLLVEEAAASGFEAEGIEPSIEAVEFCRQRGLHVSAGYLAEGVFAAHSFDVVVMSHVIEHVSHPLEVLRTARTILKRDGVLCLCQTNYRGTLPRILRRRWPAWVPWEHFWHFSPRGISLVLRQAGFQQRTLELLPLGYHPSLMAESLRSVPGAVINTFAFVLSSARIGFPFEGDQIYLLAQPDGPN